MSLQDKARRAGFKVFEKRVRYTSLTGESVEETRITGYLPGGQAKISYSEQDGRGTFTVTAAGEMATRSLADKAESLGASVDLDEGKRLYAVFRNVTRRRAGELVEYLFGARNARVGGASKERARSGQL